MITESSNANETPITSMEKNLQQRVERAYEAHDMVKAHFQQLFEEGQKFAAKDSK